MSNNKQSSIEQFIIECGKYGDTAQIPDELIEKYIAMHKEEIEDALLFGDVLSPTTAENYYKVKFGGNNKQ